MEGWTNYVDRMDESKEVVGSESDKSCVIGLTRKIVYSLVQ